MLHLDPLLLQELMEAHPDWEIHYLAEECGIIITNDGALQEILENTTLELEGSYNG